MTLKYDLKIWHLDEMTQGYSRYSSDAAGTNKHKEITAIWGMNSNSSDEELRALRHDKADTSSWRSQTVHQRHEVNSLDASFLDIMRFSLTATLCTLKICFWCMLSFVDAWSATVIIIDNVIAITCRQIAVTNNKIDRSRKMQRIIPQESFASPSPLRHYISFQRLYFQEPNK